jgi:hypothetical protein
VSDRNVAIAKLDHDAERLCARVDTADAGRYPQRLTKHDNETQQPVPLTSYVQDCLRSEARRRQGDLALHNLLTRIVMCAAVCS